MIKKTITLSFFALAIIFVTSTAFMPKNIQKNDVMEVSFGKIKFKLKNDTNKDIRIHSGSGVSKLYHKRTNSYSRNAGTKFYTAPRGSKDKFLFKVTSSMNGKTIRLSKYL